MIDKKLDSFENQLKTFKGFEPDQRWLESLRLKLIGESRNVSLPGKYIFLRPLSLAIFLILLSISGGTVILADSSVPGDFLYPIDVGIEELRLTFSDSQGDISLQRQFMNERVAELNRISLQGRHEQEDEAIREIQSSISRMEKIVSGLSSDYLNLKDAGKDTTAITESLDDLSQNIDQQQKELNQMNSYLNESSKQDVQDLQESFENLQDLVKTSLEEEILESQQKDSPSVNKESEESP